MAPRAFLGSIFGIMVIEIYSPIRLAKKREEGKGYMIEHNTNTPDWAHHHFTHISILHKKGVSDKSDGHPDPILLKLPLFWDVFCTIHTLILVSDGDTHAQNWA
jgi:hypothetical protein